MKTAFLIDFKNGGDNKSITVNSQSHVVISQCKINNLF